MSEDNFGGDTETGLDLEKGWFGKAKDWLLNNWQTVIIVLIVLIIGVGLYNYQQQKGAGEEGALSGVVEEQEEATENSDGEIAVESDWDEEENNKDEEEGDNSAVVIEENGEEAGYEEDVKTDGAGEDSVTISSENGKAYTASAERGDGITQLARKALKKYLNENSVSDINDEQKIYAEDYLQNKTGQEFLELGETREFSENLITEAIDLSRGLDDNDIENLSKYKTRIANL